MGYEDDSALSSTLRMLWLLRLVRLIRFVPPLRELFHGVLDALSPLVWVLLLMALVLYALAILCVRLIGSASIFEPSAADDIDLEEELVRDMFQNVFSSMFYLFQMMTAWSLQPLIPLFEFAPWTRAGFVVFYIFSGWTLLAVMTGNVSFRMIVSKVKVDDGEVQEQLRKVQSVVIRRLFDSIDQDGNSVLSKREFDEFVDSRALRDMVASGTNIKPSDLQELWGWMDEAGTGVVSVDKFMESFLWINEPFSQRLVVRMTEKFTREFKAFRSRLISTFDVAFDRLGRQLQAPLTKISVAAEKVQLLTETLHQIVASADNNSRNRSCSTTDLGRSLTSDALAEPSSFDEMERLLTARTEEIARRIAKFVPRKPDQQQPGVLEPPPLEPPPNRSSARLTAAFRFS